MSADHAEQDCYCCDVDYGDLPADYVFVQQVYTTDDQSDCTCFTDCTTTLTQHQFTQRSIQVTSFQLCQRCSVCSCVSNFQTVRYRPCCHFCRVGSQQECTTSQSRVDEVLTKTAKQLFAEDDSKCTTYDSNPYRSCCRQVHCQ